jgi:hypothetical protein
MRKGSKPLVANQGARQTAFDFTGIAGVKAHGIGILAFMERIGESLALTMPHSQQALARANLAPLVNRRTLAFWAPWRRDTTLARGGHRRPAAAPETQRRPVVHGRHINADRCGRRGGVAIHARDG